MYSQPIDFIGVNELSETLIDQIEEYLNEKENPIYQEILALSNSSPIPVPNISRFEDKFNLVEILENFSKRKGELNKPPGREKWGEKRIHFFASRSEKTLEEVKASISKINLLLLDLEKFMRGLVDRLFQIIDHINLVKWQTSLLFIVEKIKNNLLRRFEKLRITFHTLQQVIPAYLSKTEGLNFSKKMISLFSKEKLSPFLGKLFAQDIKILKSKFTAFYEKYNGCAHLSTKTEESLEALKEYPLLALLELEDQNMYVDLFRLLKIRELHRSTKKKLLQSEICQSLKTLAHKNHIFHLLDHYFHSLKEAFFKSSLEFKNMEKNNENEALPKLNRLKEKVEHQQQELHTLKWVISQYQFFLNQERKAHSSPLDFFNISHEKEPIISPPFSDLLYTAQDLEDGYLHFRECLDKDSWSTIKDGNLIRDEIKAILHELAQPLISEATSRLKIEQLLKVMTKCDEIGNPSRKAISIIEEALSKAMRYDWKANLLHEYPLFHEIYSFHQGLYELPKDPSHAFRTENLLKIFYKIEDWAEEKNYFHHGHEIEEELNDLKMYLQNFLAAIQQAVKNKSFDPFLDETIHKFRHQLLEYRYLFGKFCFHLKDKADFQELFQHLLFVHLYFESMEKLLYELNLSWEGKPIIHDNY